MEVKILRVAQNDKAAFIPFAPLQTLPLCERVINCDADGAVRTGLARLRIASAKAGNMICM